MASFTLTREDLFPNGTSVGAYPRTNWLNSQLPPSGAPQGSATSSGTVTAGSVTFTGLADATAYYVAGQVSGTWKYLSIQTATASTSGGGIDPSIVTTKGDLLAATSSGTVARVGVGTDGQLLRADSTQTAGIAWVSPTLHLPYITGRYYSSLLAQTSGSTVGGKAVPYFVTKTQAFDRIACFCTTIGAGSTVRLGIFADSAGVPGTLVVDAGTVDTSAATGSKELTIAQTLTTGLYWLAAVPQGGTTPGLAVANQGATSFQPIGVTAPANSVSNCYGISPAGAFANNPVATVSNSAIVVWLRAA